MAAKPEEAKEPPKDAPATTVPTETEKSSGLKIGWIGLGQMGKAHVLNLIEKGFHNLTVWNRTKQAADDLISSGVITVANSPKEVVEQSDVIFVTLSDASAVREVYENPQGILAGLSPNKGIIECSTLDAKTIQELYQSLTNRQARFVVATVAGHSGMARAATCQLICAGNESLFHEISSICDGLAKNRVWLGSSRIESASTLKLIVNGLLGSITAAMGEAMAILKQCAIDPAAFHSILTGHAMNSPLLQLCYKMMNDPNGSHDPLFMIKHMYKDTSFATELAAGKKVPVQLLPAARDWYGTAVRQGFGEKNWTGVYLSIANNDNNGDSSNDQDDGR